MATDVRVFQIDISTCEQHIVKVKVSTRTTGLDLSKNIGHAHQMKSLKLWWLPKPVHYGALLPQRQSTSIHFELALSKASSTLSK